MAAVQNNDNALQFAAEEMKQELADEAKSYNMSIKKYAGAAAHPIIIQIFESDGSGGGGCGHASITISCRDIGGNEVMTFPVVSGAEKNPEVWVNWRLHSQLASKKGVSIAAIKIINERGGQLGYCSNIALKDFLAVGK